MKRFLILLFLGSLTVGLCIGYRWFELRNYPIGSGKFLNSSDRRFQLDASNLTYEDFWGRRRECYRFSVFDLNTGGKTVRRFDIEPGPDEAVVQLRRDARIAWDAESSFVTVAFGRTELKINLTDP